MVKGPPSETVLPFGVAVLGVEGTGIANLTTLYSESWGVGTEIY